MLATIGEAVAAITMRRFLIAFDQVESFSGKPKRPLVLTGDEGATGIRMLRHDLVTALREIGFMDGKEPGFTPHMTILYDLSKVCRQVVEEIGWTATEFVLVRSLRGQSRHVPLGRWPLQG